MANCPFATQKPITGSSGAYTGGPYRIVYHTTEGSTAQGAFDAYTANRSDPHFTIDATTVYQHIDTGRAARSLANPAGGVETNKQSAVQIEIVGFAGAPKDQATLTLVARLSRWIEATHGVSQSWPSGRPKPPKNGKDPGGHNRDVNNWKTKGGYYGHSHVPENTHWDPAFTAAECDFLMSAAFTEDGRISNSSHPAVSAFLSQAAPAAPEEIEVIEDHHVIEGEER
jgi:hypothetical protein